MSVFNGAKNVVINGGSVVANAGSLPSASFDIKPVKWQTPTYLPCFTSEGGLDRLVAKVAPNAILNAGGRADEVRCYPGTREEVIGRLEEFMDDNSPGKKRILWLSGPAGAGKSAICQTVAERRSDQGRQAANFFFFRGDSSRSHAKPLVATLVYQLCRFYPALDGLLSDYLETDPLICSASIETQFKQLISLPIQTIQQSTPIQQQIIIIVDGLDECNNERDQDQIVIALHALVHTDYSPFLVIISSRAEPQLVMSFNRLGSSVQSIFLSDDYQPQKDIRLFVVAKFDEIKKDHHLARPLSKEWPPDADIDAITNKSSGQFIYAVTVMRYIQFSSLSPALSLVTILEMPRFSNHNPLAHLDAVYSYIFSKVHDIRVVKLILFARHCSKTVMHGKLVPSSGFIPMLQLVGYEDIEVQSFFADLAAIIEVVPGSNSGLLTLYHASLEDYLSDKTRSTIYCVTDEEIAVELSSMCLRNIHDARSIELAMYPLSHVRKPTPELTDSLLDASTRHLHSKKLGSSLKNLIGHIERLYWEQDKDQFQTLLQSWNRFMHINDINRSYRGIVRPQNPSASQCYERYWMAPATEEPRKQNLPTPPDSTFTGIARSEALITPVRSPPNATIDGPIPKLNFGKTGALPGNDSRNNETRAAGRRKTTTGSARSYTFLSLIHGISDSLRRKVIPLQPRKTRHTINTHEDEVGQGSGECGDGCHKLTVIRVKLHYQDDIRGMTWTLNTPFSEFVDKVAAKFGKNSNGLIMKLEDESGGKITLRDDSDYEFAIETARQSSKGEVKGILVIWCEDNV